MEEPLTKLRCVTCSKKIFWGVGGATIGAVILAGVTILAVKLRK